MTTRGVDIRQSSDRVLFRASLKDADGEKIVSGTAELRLYRLNDDGTLDVLDWTTFAFVAPGAGSPDDETTMTHRLRRDSSGADVSTGIWTAVLATLTALTAGGIYIAQVTHSDAFPESQEREFQFGGVEGDQVDADNSGTGAYIVTLTVTDDSDDPVQGAVVRLSKTGEAYTATTSANGIAVFSLDAATWTVAITAGGSYTFTPTSLVVSGDTNQTYALTDNSPSPPASPSLATGYVDCYGLDGAAEEGVEIEIELTSGPGTAGYALDKGTHTATSAANGRATHSGFVRGATYRARRGELGKWVTLTVPDAGTFAMPEMLGQP